MTQVAVLLPLLIVLLIANTAQSKTIRVEHSPDAVDSEECYMDGGPPCKTLNYAFLGVIDDTTLQIGTGTFPLENSTVLTGIQNVVISGMGEDPGSTIQCSYDKPGGLKFERCTNLTIAGIRNILNCGVLQDTTCIFGGENFTTPSPSALFFHNCTDVSMTDVTVRNSNGTGVTMYSVIGTVTVQSCEFTENQIQNDTEHASGGTGLYIEFPNCPPGVSTCESPDNVNAQYVISNCTFSFNTATVTNTYQHSFSVENGTSHVAFGRGGGPLCVLRRESLQQHGNGSGLQLHRQQSSLGRGVVRSVSGQSARQPSGCKQL